MKLRYVVPLLPLTLLMFLVVLVQSAAPEEVGLYRTIKLGGLDSYSSAAISPYGDYFAFGKRGFLRLMDSNADGLEFPLGELIVYASAFSRDTDNMRLALAVSDGTIWIESFSYLWNKAERQKNCILRGHESPIYALAFCADGQTLAAGASDGTITLWNTPTKKFLFPLRGHTQPVKSITFSPDGQTLAAGASDGSIKLWNLLTQTELNTLYEHAGSVNTIAFSLDGKTLASAGKDGKIALWDVSNPQESVPPIRVLKDEQSFPVNTIAFADGQTLASGGENSKVMLWDIHKGEKIDPINRFIEITEREVKFFDFSELKTKKHKKAILSVVFSSTRQELISVDKSGLVLVWNLSRIDISPAPKYLQPPPPLIEQLNVGKNPITVLAIDEEGNEETDTFDIYRSQPPKPSVTPSPPVAKEVPANREEPSQQTDKVVIDITSPTRKTSGKQGQPDRLHGSDGTDFSISGVVYGVDSGIIDAIVKSKTSKRERQPRTTRITKGAVEGVGNFAFPPMELYLDDNEITLTVDLESGKQAVKKVLIERFRGSGQPPEAPIQQPHRPIESPPQVTPPKQDNQPPTLTVNIFPSGEKGTANTDFVREVSTPTGPNVKGKVFEVIDDTALFRGSVIDDSRSHNIKLKINNEFQQVDADGSFSYEYSLDYGKNEITITATDEDGNSVEDKFTVYQRPNRKGKDLALFFATQDYEQFYPEETKNWSILNTPIEDAKRIAEELRDNYGFKTKIFSDLTKDEIEDTLSDYRFAFKDKDENEYDYYDDSQLLIYFTGHGFLHEDIGLIAAKDSIKPMASPGKAVSNIKEVVRTSLEVDDVRRKIEKLGCSNIFVLVDTCMGGPFDPNFIKAKGPGLLANVPLLTYIENNLTQRSKWFMTASGEEEVSDGFVLDRGKIKHSPFAEAFIRALKTRGNTNDNEDSLLTVGEVWKFIAESNKDDEYKRWPIKPRPRFGQFGNSIKDSDFLFFPVVQPNE